MFCCVHSEHCCQKRFCVLAPAMITWTEYLATWEIMILPLKWKMFQLSHQLSDVVFKSYIDWNGIIVSVNLQKQIISHSYIFLIMLTNKHCQLKIHKSCKRLKETKTIWQLYAWRAVKNTMKRFHRKESVTLQVSTSTFTIRSMTTSSDIYTARHNSDASWNQFYHAKNSKQQTSKTKQTIVTIQSTQKL